MALRRTARTRRELPPSIVLILATGFDFFSDLLPVGVRGSREMLESAWADPSIRERVYRRQRTKHPDGEPPWAEVTFGKLDETSN